MHRLILYSLLILTNITFAQIPSKTNNKKYTSCTESEYDFMSKGEQMQKGYFIEYATTLKEGVFSFDFHPVNRISGSDTLCVGFMVKIHRDHGYDNYYALPLHNKKLMDNTFKEFNKLSQEFNYAFFKCFYLFSMEYYFTEK